MRLFETGDTNFDAETSQYAKDRDIPIAVTAGADLVTIAKDLTSGYVPLSIVGEKFTP